MRKETDFTSSSSHRHLDFLLLFSSTVTALIHPSILSWILYSYLRLMMLSIKMLWETWWMLWSTVLYWIVNRLWESLSLWVVHNSRTSMMWVWMIWWDCKVEWWDRFPDTVQLGFKSSFLQYEIYLFFHILWVWVQTFFTSWSSLEFTHDDEPLYQLGWLSSQTATIHAKKKWK